jgi:glycosyltransferase involved in cell wall biosynthesis
MATQKFPRFNHQTPAEMKVLIDHQLPFLLAHGGLQIQIERTKEALEGIGIEVEYLRWWDDSQRGDIIHFFGRAHPLHIHLAHGKGMKYVMTELLSGQSTRPDAVLRAQATLHRLLKLGVPRILIENLRWDAHSKADAVIVLTEREAQVAEMLFRPPRDKLFVVPNGVDQEFFLPHARPSEIGDELLCVATIRPLKRNVELAKAALVANVPIRFVGTPYGKGDPYYREFADIAASRPDLVRYAGPVSDRNALAALYQKARGFVLLSTMESLSLSALEASAAACPLLLSDLAWARCTFGANARYCPVAPVDTTAGVLRDFYDNAGTAPLPLPPMKWSDVGKQLIKIYEALPPSA